EKRRSARRGQHSCEYALEEGAKIIFALARREQTARKSLRQGNFEYTKEIQSEHEHNHAQHENKIRICKLKTPPSDVASREFERNQKQRKRDEPRKNPKCERDATPQNFLPALARLLNESENLQRDHRQHARHQIQNHAAEKTEEQESENAPCGRWTSRRNNRRSRNLPRRAVRAVWLLGKNHEARHGRQILP